MCGTSVENCTPEKWFKFLGTYNKDFNVPFNIQFNLIKNESAKAMRDYSYGCYEPSDMSQSRCSCENCQASCEREDPYPNLEEVSKSLLEVLMIFYFRKAVKWRGKHLILKG